jgi:hypothetical protein
MPLLPIIALFIAAVALFAVGSPLGALPLMAGTIALSLKIGMPVTKNEPRAETRRSAHPLMFR